MDGFPKSLAFFSAMILLLMISFIVNFVLRPEVVSSYIKYMVLFDSIKFMFFG